MSTNIHESVKEFAIMLQRAKTFAEQRGISSIAYHGLSHAIFDMERLTGLDIPALRDADDAATFPDATSINLLKQVYSQVGNHMPASVRHVLTPGLRDDIRDFLKSHSPEYFNQQPQEQSP